jgi:hypothetical protein
MGGEYPPYMIVGISFAVIIVAGAFIEALLRAVGGNPLLRTVAYGLVGMAIVWYAQKSFVDPTERPAGSYRSASELKGHPGLALVLEQHPEDVERVEVALAGLDKNPRDGDSATALVDVVFTHAAEYLPRTSEDAIVAFASTLASGLEAAERTTLDSCGASSPDVVARQLAFMIRGREDVLAAVVKDATERPQEVPAQADVDRLFGVVLAQLQADPSLRRQMVDGSCRDLLTMYNIARMRLSRHDFATLLRGGLGTALDKVRDVIAS